MVLVKRYSNRKLYNTQARKYVSLEEISDLVKNGIDIQVVDNATGEDITEKILIQIILASGKDQTGLIPRSFLSEMIQTGMQPVISFHAAILGYLYEHRIWNLPSRQDLIELSDKIDELENKISNSS